MEDMDFGALLEQSLNGLVTDFRPGDKVTGVVTGIDSKSVFLDINSTSEGVIDRDELCENGEMKINIGDTVEAFYMDGGDDGIKLSVKLGGHGADQLLEEAFASRIPVEGKVVGERKGGYSVKVAGQDAFCPYSQMSLRGGSEGHVGQLYEFVITKYGIRDLVLSRRPILERQRDEKIRQLRDSLAIGDLVEGTVAKIMDFGVFVELDGIDAFIPISELAWGRIGNPGELLRAGDRVKAAVKDLNWDDNKITLSYRSAASPWAELEDRYPVGSKHPATITRLTHFGAFAELERGVEGLIHISKLGAGRVGHPKELVSEGESVEVVVEGFDADRHRIALSKNILPSAETSGATAEKNDSGSVELVPGALVQGVVDGVRPFGVFVKLPGGGSGLLHISQARLDDRLTNGRKALEAKFGIGSDLEVVIQKLEGDRVSLSLPETGDEAELANFNNTRGGDDDFGSLGSLLDGLHI